ncbi:site-specific integrase [Ramlibacter sp.]|uniref:site-specific integrase n=1 Tax=Ramlibacter sp. TaxID=1917967 RepID=UPI003D11000F
MAITVRKDREGKPRAFQATVRVPGEKSASRTFSTLEAALEFERATMSGIKAAKNGGKGKRKSAGLTENPAKLASFVSERIVDIVDSYYAANPEDKHIASKRHAIKRHVGQETRVCDLTRKWTRAFVARMKRTKAQGRETFLKESSINHYMRMFARVCKWRADELEVECPDLGLTHKFFSKSWNDGRTRRVRPDEEFRIREALSRIGAKEFRVNAPGIYGEPKPQAKHYVAAFDFALETCARQSEIVNLRWSEIELDSREWQLPGNRTKQGRSRTIYLTQRADQILRELWKERPQGTDRVFHLLPTPATFSKTFADAVKRAGVTGLVFHDTRHESITRMLNTGAMLPGAVLQMAGHASLQMTMRYFNPQADEVLRRMDAVHARREAAEIEQHIFAGSGAVGAPLRATAPARL